MRQPAMHYSTSRIIKSAACGAKVPSEQIDFDPPTCTKCKAWLADVTRRAVASAEYPNDRRRCFPRVVCSGCRQRVRVTLDRRVATHYTTQAGERVRCPFSRVVCG